MGSLTIECQLAIKHIIYRTNQYNINIEYNKQIPLTIKRIQAILYLSQIEYIKQTSQNLFEDEFHAWQYGPVIPGIYNMYLEYTTKSNEAIKIPEGSLSKEKTKIIDCILDCTNDIDTYNLIVCSHFIDGLWKKYYNPYDKNHRQIIKNHDILSYHRKKNNYSITSKLKTLKN